MIAGRRPAVVLESAVAIGVGVFLFASDETASGWHERIIDRPPGALVMGAATGAGIVHLWLEQRRARDLAPPARRSRLADWRP